MSEEKNDLEEVGISLKLPADKYEAFKALAKKEGMSMAAMARNMIYKRIEEELILSA